MKRRPMTKGGSKALFKKTANKTNVKNLPGRRMMRGGFHL